ncbi:uncharacterized protein LOC131849046 [Achroia grisella]|uniref:uncharacterized protein LOC131849046 n=1 Tax=Achroia grisella TaxID=688607 RepID=UPI0027D20D47|nr:uncharacterized protein LOC131849046 [Achroia grisella]
MFQTARSGVSYSIPFDELDLRYIRKDVKRNNNPLPIWSIDNNKQYYSFEVFVEKRCNEDCKKNNLQEVTEISDTPKENTYKCPICNIIVPIIYLKEHNSSLKHKTCLEIADLAMQRLRDYVFLNVTACTNETSTYFCEPCALSVDVNQKYCHEASKSHAVSLKYDNILSDLLMLYKDRENLDKICSKYLLNVDTNEIAMTKTIKSVEDNTKTTANTAATKKTVVNNETDPELVDLIDYFENINANLDGQGHISVTDKDFILITVDNSKLRVNISNFHGFSTCEDSDETFCSLCRVILKSADLEAHCKNGKHIDNISVPLRDQHCVRSIEVSPWHVHCILCNKYTERINEHFISTEHKHALNNSLIYETNDTINKTLIYTDVSHNDDDEYESMSNSSISTDKGSDETAVKKLRRSTDYQIGVIPSNLNEAMCKVCKVLIPFHKTNITHKLGNNHRLKYNSLLSTNRLQRTEKGFNCAICHTTVTYKNELDHINGKSHQSNIQKTLNCTKQKFCQPCNVNIDAHNYASHEKGKQHLENLKHLEIKTESVNTRSSKDVQTNIDRKFVVQTSNSFKQLKTDSNMSNNISVGMNTSGAKNDVRKKYCQTCNLSIDVHNFIAHEKENLRQNRAATARTTPPMITNTKLEVDNNNLLKQTFLDLNNFVINESEDETVDDCKISPDDTCSDDEEYDEDTTTADLPITKSLLLRTTDYQFDVGSNVKEAICKVCRVLVPFHEKNITEHKLGQTHKSNYKMVLSSNGVQEIENGFKCTICNVIISNKNELDHINGKNHQSNITKSTKSTREKYCQSCNIYMNVHNFESHKKGKRHMKNLRLSDNYSVNTTSSMDAKSNLVEQWYCQFFDVNIDAHSFVEHENDKQHLDNLQQNASDLVSTTSSNSNREVRKYCNTCHIYIDTCNYASHEKGKRHLKNFTLIDMKAILKHFNGYSAPSTTGSNTTNDEKRFVEQKRRMSGIHDNVMCVMLFRCDVMISAWHIHCILCNKCIYTKRIDDHFRSETHTLALNESLIDETVNANDISIGTAKDLKEDHSLDIFTATEDDTDSHYETGDDVSLHSVPKLTPAPTNEPLHYQMNVSTNPKEVTCRVCKVVVPNKIINVIEHIMAKNHKTKYDALLLNNKLKRTGNGFNCHFCQVDIDNTNELEHMDSEAHQKAMKTLNDYPTINIKYCAACKEYIRTSVFDKHESTAKHKSNLEIQPAKEEKIIPTLNIYCKEYIPNSELDVHESTAKHKSNLKTQPAKEEKIIPMLSIYCAVCKEYIPNSVLDVHESTAKHKSNLKTQPAKEEKIIPTLSIYCAVCKEYIPNSVLDVHESTAKHKSNLKTQPTKEEKNIIISKTNIHYHLQKTNIASELKCTICNVSIPSKSNCITEHIMGNIHTSRYDMFLVKNKLKKVENGFHCDICKVKITNMNELSHINGKNHQKNILTFNQSDPVKDITNIQPNDINDENAAIPSTSSNILKIVTKKYCRPCNIYVDVNNFTSHERGKRHKGNLKLNEIDSVSTTTSSTSVSGMTYCQSCNIHIHTHNIDSHTMGNKHLKQLKISETKPVDTHLAVISKYLCYLMSPTEDPNELMCKICKIAIAKSNLMRHLKARRHKKKYNTLLSSNEVRKIETGFHCDICEVNVTDMNEFNHIFSETHQYKIANEAHVTIEADESVTNRNNTLYNVTDLQTQEDEENYSSLLC